MIENVRFENEECSSVQANVDGTTWYNVRLGEDGEINRKVSDWMLAGNTPESYVPPPVDLLRYAAEKRWQKETGGISLGGIPIATDDRSKLMMMGARIKASESPEFTTPWVGADGLIYPVDAATIVAISDAVLAHVAACFNIFETLKAGVDAGTVTTVAQVDAAFA